jgi:hypothetical protein
MHDVVPIQMSSAAKLAEIHKITDEEFWECWASSEEFWDSFARRPAFEEKPGHVRKHILDPEFQIAVR